MAETQPSDPGVIYTDTQVRPDFVKEQATYQYQEKSNTNNDVKQTKIKSTRNWYPDIDGNDVTKSYTTGF